MKKYYIILLLAISFPSGILAQEMQKNFINYQGVARDANNELMEQEAISVGIALRFGAASAKVVYEESHSISTDANGVFSLKIGNGNTVNGSYPSLPWGIGATFMTVSLDGVEIGTTELMAVPYAISSGDKQWVANGDNIENKNEGEVSVNNDFRVKGGFNLSVGNQVNEISVDGTLADNSNGILPTQRAVKTYVDNRFFSGGGGAQTADELVYDNSVSGLAATDTQAAIDELASGSGGIDTDPDPTNEFQLLSFDTTTNELSLSDGNAVTIPSGGTDADADPTNEFQNLALSGTTLSISDGTGVDLSALVPPGGTDDQNAGEVPYDNTISGLTASDAQAAIDELASGGLVDTDDQALVLTGDVLTIEDGVGSVDLSAYKDDLDKTTKTGILIGDGTNVSGLIGTADGQVAKWNAGTSEWEAGTDATGAGGSSLWTDNGGDIHYNSGRVGIGATSPFGQLQVSKASGGAPFLVLEATSGSETDMRFVKEGTSLSWDQISNIGADEASSTMNHSFYDGGTLHPVMTLRGNRRMGINNSDPQTALDVGGQIRSSDLSGGGNVIADADGNLIIGAGSGGSSLWSENADNIYFNTGKVGIGSTDPTGKLTISDVSGFTPFLTMAATTDNPINIRFTEEGNDLIWNQYADLGADEASSMMNFSFWDGGTDNNIMTLRGNRRMGINNSDPQTALDVGGQIRSSDLSGGGNVIADANGNLIIGGGGSGTSTGLETIDEGNGPGWRLIGMDPTHFGPIGSNAVDLSISLFDSANLGATGSFALATGHNTRAEGDWSTATGRETSAEGEASVSTGFQTMALGDYSFTTGRETIAAGSRSVAMGMETSAANIAAFSMGMGTYATGRYSSAMGINTRSDAQGSFAVGKFNVGGGDPDNWVDTDPIFEIGIGGNVSSRANAMTVLKNGNIGIGEATPTAKLDVDGNIRSTDLTGAGERNVVADANGNLIISAAGGGSSLWTQNGSDINYTTGNVGIGTEATGASLHISDNSEVAKPHIKLEEDGNDYARIELTNNTSSALWHVAGLANNTPADSKLNFYYRNNSSASNRMTITGAGNVGIGTIDPTAKLDVRGDVKISGEVNRPPTGAANLVPIAYGNVAANGGINTGSGNFSVGKDGTGRYLIKIQGESYHFTDYVTVATRISGPGFISASSLGGTNLLVKLQDITGSDENATFNFVVYKP